MRAPRNADPIPNATTSASFDSGLAMSGRIGISLASTVRRVIDVPATQSSRVVVALAGLDRRDLVLGRGEDRRVDRRQVGLVRLDEQTRGNGRGEADDRDHGADAAEDPARSFPGSAATRAPGRAPRSRRRGPRSRPGIPGRGIRKNGTTSPPAIAPTRVRGQQRARSLAGPFLVVGKERRRRRERDAEHDRDGQDREQRQAHQATERFERAAGRRLVRRDSTSSSPASASAPATIWLPASRRSGSPTRERTTAKTMAPSARPARKVVRIMVNT